MGAATPYGDYEVEENVINVDNLTEEQMERLDNEVHDYCSLMASDTNNAMKWVDFLLAQGYTLDQIQDVIDGRC